MTDGLEHDLLCQVLFIVSKHTPDVINSATSWLTTALIETNSESHMTSTLGSVGLGIAFFFEVEDGVGATEMFM
jgi:hypothetical protein